MRRFLLLLITIVWCSCSKVLQSTIGRYYINTIHNTGTVVSGGFQTSIPFKTLDNHIYLNISGRDTAKQFSFLFDTGAYSGISEEIVAEFDGFYNNHNFSTKDVNDSTSSPQRTFALERLSLGNLDIFNLNFVVTNYQDENLDGIIGSNLLEGKIFIFNPYTDTVTITNNQGLIDESKLQSYKLKKRWDKRYFLKLRSNTDTRRYMIDTGFDGFLLTNEPFANDLILKQKRMRIPIMGAYSTGIQEIAITQIKNFNLNNISIDTANIELSNFGNLLGSEIFHHGITILDFIDNRIHFEKDLAIPFIGQPPYEKDVYFALYENNTVVATVDVSLDSINIAPFDIVLKVNGVPIPFEKYNPEDIFKQALKDGTNHFMVKRGAEVIDIYLDRSRIGIKN